MPLYHHATEIENGRTTSENGMVIERQQELREIWQWVISILYSPPTVCEGHYFCREIFMGLKLTH